jgi:hypothetical protein
MPRWSLIGFPELDRLLCLSSFRDMKCVPFLLVFGSPAKRKSSLSNKTAGCNGVHRGWGGLQAIAACLVQYLNHDEFVEK